MATYHRDGTVLLSPVWHEWSDGGFTVVIGTNDIKGRHLRRDPRVSIVLYEDDPPYRGIEIRGAARFVEADVKETARRIAVRYLGEAAGNAYADGAAAWDETWVRIEPGVIRTWDYADEYET